MEPVECFLKQRSGVAQIFLEKEKEKIGNGSGFLIKGGIVTNSHVIRKASFDTIAIRFDDTNPEDQESYIRIVIDDVVKAESSEEEKDYAFLRMEEPEFEGRHRFNFAIKENIEVGQRVAFMGYPFGMFNLTSHIGYLSSIYVKNEVKIFQIDGSINGGNSGGPLVSLDTGNVIGIVTRAQTGLIEDQFNNLIRTFEKNRHELSKFEISISFAGFNAVEGFIETQDAMEIIVQNLRRSANVGIGYAFSSEYVRDSVG